MKKRFGQNFMTDPAFRRKVVDLALDGHHAGPVWEVGPGIGAITSLLLERGTDLRVFEIDFGFARVLEGLFGGRPNFRMIIGDVLKTWKDAAKAERPARICGNLPYSVGSVFIGSLLEEGGPADEMVFTLQKEVISRMAARPGSGYSGFSVLCQTYYTVEHCFDIPAAAFFPAPEVTSSVVRMRRRSDIVPPGDPARYARLIRSAFAARRKTLANNLKAGAGSLGIASMDQLAEAAEAAGFRLTDRAEILTADRFLAFAAALGM